MKSIFAYIRSIETQTIECSAFELAVLNFQTLKELEQSDTSTTFSPLITVEENNIIIKWRNKDIFVKTYGYLLCAFGVLFSISIIFSLVFRDVNYLIIGVLGVLFVVIASRFVVILFRHNTQKNIKRMLTQPV